MECGEKRREAAEVFLDVCVCEVELLNHRDEVTGRVSSRYTSANSMSAPLVEKCYRAVVPNLLFVPIDQPVSAAIVEGSNNFQNKNYAHYILFC